MGFIQALKKRNSGGQNFIMVSVGETGIGKSYSALRIGEVYDPNFTADNIIFDELGFMRRVREMEEYSVMIFDDAGLAFSSRDWMTDLNKIIGFVLQSFRWKIINLIFTVPYKSLLDNVGQGLTHYMLVMKSQGRGKLYRLKYNQMAERVFKYKRGILELEKPDKALTDEYEKRKREYLNKAYDDYEDLAILREEERKRTVAQKLPVNIHLTKIVENYQDYIRKGKVDPGKIMINRNLGRNKAVLLRNEVEEILIKKGLLKQDKKTK